VAGNRSSPNRFGVSNRRGMTTGKGASEGKKTERESGKDSIGLRDFLQKEKRKPRLGKEEDLQGKAEGGGGEGGTSACPTS